MGDIKKRFWRSTYEITAEYGERDKPFGRRNTLITQLCKAVLGVDKEVVTADTVAVAKGEDGAPPLLLQDCAI
jgi:hypothetical protein